MLLSVNNLSKTFQSGQQTVEAVKSVSFSINTGEIIVISGKSGSGKSTLLNMIGGLMSPSSGDVIFNGVSIYKLQEKERCALSSQSFGFVFQGFNLIDEMTAINNIRLPLDIQGKAYDGDYEQQIFEMLGIADRLTFYPHQLSGGEQQRVATARALLTRPPIILADEPTGNLDLETGNQIKDFVLNSNRKNGQAYIIVTHDLEWKKIADRNFQMSDGRLLEEA